MTKKRCKMNVNPKDKQRKHKAPSSFLFFKATARRMNPNGQSKNGKTVPWCYLVGPDDPTALGGTLRLG